MTTQYFRVTRAPEAAAATAQEIKHALMDVRRDTEWDVREITKIDYNRYVYSGFARELERENNRLKKQVVELTEMLIEVRDNPNNNIFEKFEKGVNIDDGGCDEN